jgi:hypothetical protein
MRKTAFVLCFILLVLNLQAQEDKTVDLQQNNEKRFNLEGAFHFGEIKGASLGFGILLYNKGTWNIRSHTYADSYTMTTDKETPSILNITEKITAVGVMSDVGIGRPYGYIEGGICLYTNQSKEDYFSTPLWYKAGVGAGVDINVIKNTAWYCEFGLVWHFMENNSQMNQVFTTGFRFYL